MSPISEFRLFCGCNFSNEILILGLKRILQFNVTINTHTLPLSTKNYPIQVVGFVGLGPVLWSVHGQV